MPIKSSVLLEESAEDLQDASFSGKEKYPLSFLSEDPEEILEEIDRSLLDLEKPEDSLLAEEETVLFQNLPFDAAPVPAGKRGKNASTIDDPLLNSSITTQTGFSAVPLPPAEEKRKKGKRRRQIDPTTCERDYSNDEIEFMNALDEYKRSNGRMFPTCSEILEVIRSLGYVKLPMPGTESAVSEEFITPLASGTPALAGEETANEEIVTIFWNQETRVSLPDGDYAEIAAGCSQISGAPNGNRWDGSAENDFDYREPLLIF